MKISVATDSTGKIIGFAHVREAGATASTDTPRKTTPALKIETTLGGDDGQSVHDVELSAALERHVGKDTFPDELFRHVVVKQGTTFALAEAKRG
jgi:hypothetical protein